MPVQIGPLHPTVATHFQHRVDAFDEAFVFPEELTGLLTHRLRRLHLENRLRGVVEEVDASFGIGGHQARRE